MFGQILMAFCLLLHDAPSWEEGKQGVKKKPAAPRETRFLPSRVLESRVALEGGPGDWNIHQMHAVLPARPGRCRVLFRMSTDFVLLPGVARSVGGRVWSALAEMVLHEQLEEISTYRLTEAACLKEALATIRRQKDNIYAAQQQRPPSPTSRCPPPAPPAPPPAAPSA